MIRKVVVMGDSGCGKTSLINAFTDTADSFRPHHEPTVFDHIQIEVLLDDRSVNLSISDTPGHDDFSRLRNVAIADAGVVLICFAIDNPESLVHAQHIWLPEVVSTAPDATTVLVGCKADLRHDPASVWRLRQSCQRPVSTHDGEAAAQAMNSAAYLECSARNLCGVTDVFETACRIGAKSLCIVS